MEKITSDAHEQEISFLKQIQNLSRLVCELQDENKDLKARLGRFELDSPAAAPNS